MKTTTLLKRCAGIRHKTSGSLHIVRGEEPKREAVIYGAYPDLKEARQVCKTFKKNNYKVRVFKRRRKYEKPLSNKPLRYLNEPNYD